MIRQKSLQTYVQGAISRAGAKATTCPNIQGGVYFLPTAYNTVTNIAYGAGIEGCSDLSVKTVALADVAAGTIFIGGAGVNSGEQKGSITVIDVATSKQIAKQGTPYPMYSGVLVTPDLVWSGSRDGTFGAYDAKTLEPKWTLNVGTPFEAPPITYSVGGKEYSAIAGGGNGVANFGHPELSIKQAANMIWVFTVD